MAIDAKYRFSLDRSSKKTYCPSCRQKRFVSYKDNETGDDVSNHVGRCDREYSCGYHFTPSQYFKEHPEKRTASPMLITDEALISNTVDFLPFDSMDRSVKLHGRCELFSFLRKLFTEDIARQLCLDYFIGSSKDGYTTFWQVDTDAKVRQVKVIRYNPVTGKRNKHAGVFFAGKKIVGDSANLEQCFFGEHLLCLLQNEKKPVALVESEKTAVIASVYYPEFVWLATGGKHGCKWTQHSVCKVLSGKKVILFPDLGAYESWAHKAQLLSAVAGCQVFVSNLLEEFATIDERIDGLDIADFLLREKDQSQLALTDYRYPVIWDYQIKELEQ